MDMEKARCFVYKKDETPKMVYEEDAESYYKKGWFDSPAKFLDKETGLDPDNEIHVLAVEGVKDSMNGALNLHLMSEKELNKYAKKHCGGMKFHHLLKKPGKIKKIEEYLNSPDIVDKEKLAEKTEEVSKDIEAEVNKEIDDLKDDGNWKDEEVVEEVYIPFEGE